MKIHELSNKKILVVGLGLEGTATVRFLRQFVPSAMVGTTDVKDGPDYLNKQREYDLAIRSPGVPKELIDIPYTTATNIFFANTKGQVIGITGTKGKSTTTSLIYELLKESGKRVHLCGNIGRPLLNELRQEDDADEIYVCELSSYQLTDIQYSPHISVIINLFPEHMNYHGTVANYFAAKKRIIQFANNDDYFVYNQKYPELVDLAKRSKIRSLPFIQKLPFPDADIPLLGSHNKDNVRAAVTVAGIYGISSDKMRSAVKNFIPLPHRLQNVGTYNGITFYDDAISTTPESTICAIESFSQIGTILVGGQDRGYDFRTLVDVIAGHNIKNVIYFPDSGKKIAQLLERYPNVTAFPASNMSDAVKLCYQYTPINTVCLLSCASPSYSLWKNFEEKGNLFQQFVKKYAIS